MAALVIAQWNRHDTRELLDLVGARHANAQSPDPTLPGAFDPAAGGGMNNPSGFNNMNPANPAAQLMNSNAQQSPSNQIFTKDATRPTAWPSKQAISWGAPVKPTAQPIPGADGLPGISLTQYQESLDTAKPAAAAPVDPNVPLGLQYPNPNPNATYPTASNYSNPAAPPPSYPSTGMQSAPPYAGCAGGYPPPAYASPGNAPVGYPPPANYPRRHPPVAYPTTSAAPPGNAPVGNAPVANTPLSNAPVGYPPAAIASTGNTPINYPLPTNAPPTYTPVESASAGSVPPGNTPPGNAPTGSVPPGSPPTAATGQPAAAEVDYGKRLPGTRIIARVGTEFVLEADVAGYVNDMILRNKDRIPKDQVEKVREELMKQRLSELIQTKVVLCELRGKIPAEGFKKFSEKLGQNFDEEEVPKALERTGAKSRFELDDQMRAHGRFARSREGVLHRASNGDGLDPRTVQE